MAYRHVMRVSLALIQFSRISPSASSRRADGVADEMMIPGVGAFSGALPSHDAQTLLHLLLW